MIQKSKGWLEGINNVETFENNGVDIRLFDSDSFHFVFSYITFQHMPEEVFYNYLSEINRVLKTAGLLRFQICLGKPYNPPFEDTLTLRVYEEDKLLKNLYEKGFKVVDKSLISKGVAGVYDNYFMLAQKEKGINLDKELSWLKRECSDRAITTECRILFELAKRYTNKDDKDMAIEALNELITLNPRHLEGWLEIVNLMLTKNRIDDAILVLQDMLESNPTYYMGYVSLIKLLRMKSLDAEATEAYNLLKEHRAQILEALNKIE